jgi:hypothetical protein
VRLSPLGTSASIGLLYQSFMVDDDECGAVGGMRIGRGKPKYSEKTCPSATLSTRNTTWPDLGSSPDRRGGKPARNHLNYGTAHSKHLIKLPLNLVPQQGTKHHSLSL